MFDYDTQTGFLMAVTDPEGHVTSFERDARGLVTLQTLDDGRQIAFVYDEIGNVTAVTPPGRPAHGFAYDSLDRTTSYDPPVVQGVPDPATGYDWDLDRELQLVSLPDSRSIDHAYDAAGRLSTITIARGSYTYGYDPQTGQLASIGDPDGGC